MDLWFIYIIYNIYYIYTIPSPAHIKHPAETMVDAGDQDDETTFFLQRRWNALRCHWNDGEFFRGNYPCLALIQWSLVSQMGCLYDTVWHCMTSDQRCPFCNHSMFQNIEDPWAHGSMSPHFHQVFAHVAGISPLPWRWGHDFLENHRTIGCHKIRLQHIINTCYMGVS